MEPIKHNEQLRKQLYNKSLSNYQKSLNILYYNDKTYNSPQVMYIKNSIGELQFNNSNFAKSEAIIKEIKAAKQNNPHSEISKACLLKSKIAYWRGQYKNALNQILQSQEILKKAIIKKDEKSYQLIFQNNQTFRDIKIHKSKIYFMQKQYELSLKEIQYIRKIVNKNSRLDQSYFRFAQFQEIKAQNVFFIESDDYKQYFQNAISLRSKQAGSLNLHNGITYCNYAKYLIFQNKIQQAIQKIKKAEQVFSCFQKNHPITFLYITCLSAIHLQKKQLSDANQCINLSIAIVEKKFDADHITFLNLRLSKGLILRQQEKNLEESSKILKQLENDINNQLQNSITRSQNSKIDRQIDDEKINIVHKLHKSLRQNYIKMKNLGKFSQTEFLQQEENLNSRVNLISTFSFVPSTKKQASGDQ